MKKIISLLLCVLFIFCFAACGESDSGTVYDGNGKETAKDDKRIDLTEMSATMVYSEVSQMMSVPEDYEGKTIKMAGVTALYKSEDNSQVYYACIIKDATACCSQGLEFLLKDGFEYPEKDTEITLEGTFETYYEGETRYCRIANADLL